MSKLAPIGILGGTFDPIHHGHLRLAIEAMEQCALQQVRLIPSGTPPHRTAPQAAPDKRLEMVRLALHGHAGLVLDEREVHRTDPCYTVDTLASLRAALGAAQPLCLILGSDAFLALHTWRDWTRLFELAHLVVMQRPGKPLGNAMLNADAALQAAYQARLAPVPALLHDAPHGNIVALDMPLLAISATDIRQRCASRRDIHYLVPDAVAHHISFHNLYTSCSL